MKLSANCFNDLELRGDIESNGVLGRCDVTGIESPVVEMDDYSEFFEGLLGLFDNDPLSNDDLSGIIQRDWHLFSDNRIAKIITDEALNKYRLNFDAEHVCYKKSISDYVAIWSSIKHDLEFESRYFTDLDKYSSLNFDFNDFLKKEITLSPGMKLYRSRVQPDKVAKYDTKGMGCPPRDVVSGGRANPIGIPYLYLCGDVDTTFYEVRARYKDRVSVGTFIVQSNLELVNLTNRTSLYLSSNSSNFEDGVKQKLFLNAIASDMSKPLSRYDTELEYVPTQFVCELCKRMGADGICFKSSLHRSGMNYVLFCGNDDSKIKCSSVDSYTIEHVEIGV